MKAADARSGDQRPAALPRRDRAAQRPAALHVGTNAENSLIGSYRNLPPLTALRQRQEIGQAGRQSKGPELARFQPVCAPSCCSGRRSPAPRQYHGRTPPSCPPRIRHTLFHETDTGSALRLPAFIEWLYFTQQFSVLFPSFSVATFRRRSSCAALALPAPGTDRVRFCAALLSRPQPPTTSLAPPFSARLKRNRMVDDGHR